MLLPDPQDTLVGGGGTKDLKELFCLISALLLDMVSPFPPIRLRMSLPADLKSVVCDVSHFDPIRGDLTCPITKSRYILIIQAFLDISKKNLWPKKLKPKKHPSKSFKTSIICQLKTNFLLKKS